jgi:hypothetical protein
MEELVEMDVIPEMGISVEFGVTTINGSSTMFISAEEMDESMLDLFGTSSEVHELLVSFIEENSESLHHHYRWDIRPGGPRRSIGGIVADYNQHISNCRGQITHLSIKSRLTANQIGPRQLELPPNIPDRESPGQYPTPNSSPLTFIEKGCSW